MPTTWALRVVLFALVCGIAAGAAMVHRATASSSASAASAAPMSRVAGTVSAQVVVNRFRAIGRKVVGLGTATSTYTDANGVKTVKRKHFWMSIRSHRTVHQASAVCQILFLEIGEVDLTLAGLHAFLRAANPGDPIRLRRPPTCAASSARLRDEREGEARDVRCHVPAAPAAHAQRCLGGDDRAEAVRLT